MRRLQAILCHSRQRYLSMMHSDVSRAYQAVAEGEGVEPLALLRCQRRFSRPFAPASATFRLNKLAEGVGIEPTQPLRADYDLASRCIAALPTFRGTTRKIDLMNGARGVESNPRHPAYKTGALPTELLRRLAFGFVSFASWCSILPRRPVGHGAP